MSPPSEALGTPGPPPGAEAALAIRVPEAEPLVGPFRTRYDPSAAAGVPAHITIVYPFIPHLVQPEEAGVELARLFGRWPAFAFSLAEVRTFPEVIYLAPEPAQRFEDLIAAVVTLFPDSPPYGGQFETVVPHLTVAQAPDPADLAQILGVFRPAAEPSLPLFCHADEVSLLDNTEGRWVTRRTFPLLGGRGRPGPSA